MSGEKNYEKNIILVGSLLLLIPFVGCKKNQTSTNTSVVSSSVEVNSSEGTSSNAKESVSLSEGVSTSSTTSSLEESSSSEANVGVITNDLFISEFFNIHFKENIIETRANDDKAIELYNPTDAEIDLSKYHVELYSNAQTTPKNDGFVFTLSGKLKPYTCYTIVNKYASKELKDLADQLDTVYIGAKSSVALFKDNKIIDVFGTIGADYKENDEFVINGTPSVAELHNVVRNVGYTANTLFTETEWTVRQDIDLSTIGVHDKDTVQKEVNSEKSIEEAKEVLDFLKESYFDTFVCSDVDLISELNGFNIKYDFQWCNGVYDNTGKLLKPETEDYFYINFAITILDDKGNEMLPEEWGGFTYVSSEKYSYVTKALEVLDLVVSDYEYVHGDIELITSFEGYTLEYDFETYNEGIYSDEGKLLVSSLEDGHEVKFDISILDSEENVIATKQAYTLFENK